MSVYEILGLVAWTLICPFIIAYLWDAIAPWRMRRQWEAHEDAKRRARGRV